MLKSLELFGFKSFADRTRFDFSTGITSVVGPNGSGKSNVVDAMKWILGDQSAKSLRGKEMTDVIFNGSASRKPSAYAEATITFDNASGWLPSDAQEVQVGRRIWRNGDAEYLLNRATARLKDIKDLFMGTGAGTSAYSIIEQGRVDQILQANPTSRRAVFEEAAGISRFKSRKIEAQRKRERVGQDPALGGEDVFVAEAGGEGSGVGDDVRLGAYAELRIGGGPAGGRRDAGATLRRLRQAHQHLALKRGVAGFGEGGGERVQPGLRCAV